MNGDVDLTGEYVEGWHCPGCGRDVAARLVTCPRCGIRNPDAPPPPPPPAPKDPRVLAPVADQVDPIPGRNPTRREPTDWRVWVGRLGRALSFRVILLALFGGGAFAVLIQLVWKSVPLMPVFWTIAALLYLMAVFNDEQMVKCRACGKRVKLGYSTCHHCGYSL